MKKLKLSEIILTLVTLLIGTVGFSQHDPSRKGRTQSFDQGWLFTRENPTGAEKPDFTDYRWRTLNLPHDWSIEDLPNQQQNAIAGPFSKTSIGKLNTGNTVGGTAWYRKHFTISKADGDKTAYLQFDGVYMDADVWVNGKHLGNHPYGYTSFWYDITPYLNPAGQANVVAVQVKNEGVNSRWYSGSGIYRHTWLTLANPVHIAPWGVSVTTPDATAKKANVTVMTTITNAGKKDLPIRYGVKLLNPSGTESGRSNMSSTVPAGKSVELKQVVALTNPALWSLEKTNLYQAQVELVVGNQVEDKLTTVFGVRSIHVDAQTGFTLNGKTIKLKGGCIHHDNGPLGAAAIDRAEERKIEILKKAGFNAIRCSHNPPSPYLLDVCDRLGILVIDEAFDMWEKPKKPQDYSRFFSQWWKKDITDLVLRDRNHPSIVMWSIGNEIPERFDSKGLDIARELVQVVKKLDLTRPVTEAVNIEFRGKPWDKTASMFALLDVAGYNYEWKRVEADHQQYPDRVIFGSESHADEVYDSWKVVEKYPYVIGDFVWTAMDYFGEAGLAKFQYFPTTNTPPQLVDGVNMKSAAIAFNSQWPWFGANCGDIDVTGGKKPQLAYREVIWGNSLLEMNVHAPVPVGQTETVSLWGWPDEWPRWRWKGHEGQPLQVRVFTKASAVKLELNGKIVGQKQLTPGDKYIAAFEVPYQPGELRAIAYEDGKQVATSVLKTPGEPVAIRLVADRTKLKADGQDLSFVTVELVDAKGNLVSDADDVLVNLDISGEGTVAGVGNGSPTDTSSFQQPRKKSWKGKSLAIIRSTGTGGKIRFTAKSEGLTEAVVVITTK